VLDTQINQVNWTVGIEKQFTMTPTVAYSYYRLNVTDANTAATFGEVKLYEQLASGFQVTQNYLLTPMSANSTAGVIHGGQYVWS
jgi:hypothetical protein